MGEIENTNDGNGWISYDALVLLVEHRFGDLNLETSYVRSKNLNIDSGLQIFGQYHGVQSNQDPNNPADNKSFANADYTECDQLHRELLVALWPGKEIPRGFQSDGQQFR